MIQLHKQAIEILEGISAYERRIKRGKESLQGIQGTFPKLVEKHNHEIEIYEKCILRLRGRYEKILTKIKQ